MQVFICDHYLQKNIDVNQNKIGQKLYSYVHNFIVNKLNGLRNDFHDAAESSVFPESGTVFVDLAADWALIDAAGN